MITSSQFFDKSFFTPDQSDQKGFIDELSPWSLVSSKAALDQSQKNYRQFKKRNLQTSLRGYEISRDSSQKYIQKKLKAKSFLNNSRQLSPVEESNNFQTIEQKINILELKNEPVDNKKEPKCTGSLQFIKKVKHKKKSQLFPQITINQYNDLKARGSSLLSGTGIDQVLERKRNRKRILEEFGRNDHIKSKATKMLERHSRSIQQKEIISGRYVCIAKNPQFSVNGFPTTKLCPQF